MDFCSFLTWLVMHFFPKEFFSYHEQMCRYWLVKNSLELLLLEHSLKVAIAFHPRVAVLSLPKALRSSHNCKNFPIHCGINKSRAKGGLYSQIKNTLNGWAKSKNQSRKENRWNYQMFISEKARYEIKIIVSSIRKAVACHDLSREVSCLSDDGKIVHFICYSW